MLGFTNTRWGLIVRIAGESSDAARAHGLLGASRSGCCATMAGGFLAGIGGSFLSLFYPGSWNEGLSSRAGPDGGGAGDLRALGSAAAACRRRCSSAAPARSGRRCSRSASRPGYHLFNAAPYVLTLVIMIITCSPKRTLTGAPAELSITK